jgi:hypothetical protein
MYRLGIEMILGLQCRGEHLQIHPSIPKEWTHYQINYRFGKSLYHILVKQQRDGTSGANPIVMDGKVLADGMIPLKDDEQTHELRTRLINSPYAPSPRRRRARDEGAACVTAVISTQQDCLEVVIRAVF